jgi:hypothetical protein
MQLKSEYIKLMLMEIDDQFQELLRPEKFVKNFNTMQCFENWCTSGDIEDLEETLVVFGAYELYEHCAIIKKVINDKHLE